MVRHVVGLQLANIPAATIEALAQAFTGVVKCFCALLGQWIPGVFAVQFLDQIQRAFLVFKQTKDFRIGGLQSVQHIAKCHVANFARLRKNRQSAAAFRAEVQNIFYLVQRIGLIGVNIRAQLCLRFHLVNLALRFQFSISHQFSSRFFCCSQYALSWGH